VRNTLDIIIVNWNSGKQLYKCLRSIEATLLDGFKLSRVVIVDNASTDDSMDELGDISLPLSIINNATNQGFGAACNQGSAVCDAHYLLFLNPDTKLFENSLTVPLHFMEDETNQDVGICGIQLVDKDGNIGKTSSRFPSLLRFLVHTFGLNKFPEMKMKGSNMAEWDHLSNKTVDQLIGAFFFVRRDVFNLLKGFDEQFFVYFEEVDFSLRAKQAGWKSTYLSDAQAFHQGGGTSQQVKASRLFYSLRSRLQYGFKHFSTGQAWLLVGVTMFVEPLTRLVFCVIRRQWRSVMDTLSGYRLLWGALPGVVRSRRENN